MQALPAEKDSNELVDMDLTPSVSMMSSVDMNDVLHNNQSILGGIRQATLQDLGSIDWSRVLDNPESRMRPEGGSPLDEDTLRSKFNSVNKTT
jgi:hypothetical protein